MNKSLTALMLLVPLSAVSLPAAATSTASGDYFGGFSVHSHAHLLTPFDVVPRFGDQPGIRAGMSSSAGLTPSLNEFRIGYAWTRRFAVEAEFARTGSLAGMSANLLPPNSRGVGLDAVGTLPIAAGLSVLGRAGVRRVTGEIDAGQLLPNGMHQMGVLNQAKLGLGLQYQFSRSLGFRAEVERYRNIGTDRQVADSDGDAFRFGVYWRF